MTSQETSFRKDTLMEETTKRQKTFFGKASDSATIDDEETSTISDSEVVCTFFTFTLECMWNYITLQYVTFESSD